MGRRPVSRFAMSHRLSVDVGFDTGSRMRSFRLLIRYLWVRSMNEPEAPIHPQLYSESNNPNGGLQTLHDTTNRTRGWAARRYWTANVPQVGHRRSGDCHRHSSGEYDRGRTFPRRTRYRHRSGTRAESDRSKPERTGLGRSPSHHVRGQGRQDRRIRPDQTGGEIDSAHRNASRAVVVPDQSTRAM
jgi:hypothetical protein